MVSDNNVRLTLDRVLSMVEGLPIKEKAELAQLLIGEQSGLCVVLENKNLRYSVVEQIETMSRDQLSAVLELVAKRLKEL